MAIRLTTEQFIERARKVHGDRYDYSKVEYVKSSIKVNIVCKEHGSFWQKPNNHLQGKNCLICSGSNKKTTEDIIKEFRATHGNKYDYSLVDYKKNTSKVNIICKKHGVFQQSSVWHKKGQGCQKCGYELNKLNRRTSIDSFINKSKIVHNNKYDYSLVNYKNAHNKVIIVCPIHGEFEQTPSDHLSGRECNSCGYVARSKFQKENPTGWTISSWSEKANKSKKFDSFKVYIIKCWNDREKFYKVGRTFRTVKNRFKDVKSMPYNYNIIKEFVFDSAKGAYDYETKIKKENKIYKHSPGIKFDGKQECFTKIDI